MNERTIYNPSFKKEGHVWVNHNFLIQVSMFDKVIVNNHGTTTEGYVVLISRKGVNINLGYGDRFYKWCHVIAIKKTVSELKKYVVVFYNPTACQTQVFMVEAKNGFRAGREFYRKYKRKGLIETIYEF